MTRRIHVTPLDDFITHEESAECVCGPRTELVRTDHGDGWLITHHSADGRELTEPDHGSGVSDA